MNKKPLIIPLNTCAQRRRQLAHYRKIHKKGTLLWGCAFRKDCLERSLKVIRGLGNRDVVVGGCLPSIAPHRVKGFKTLPWKRDKALLKNRDIFVEPPIRGSERFYDRFIKVVVSEGCTRKCAYCSERRAFPPYHSFPVKGIVEKVLKMVNKTGVDRVLLLADSLGEYGRDIKTSLPVLLRGLMGLRVALNNLHPSDFLRFWGCLTNAILEGDIYHLNLPIQSASTGELRRMKRGYTARDLERIFTWLDKAGFKDFDTHLLIGFQGQTQRDLTLTLNFLKKHRPRYVLLSRYLPLRGTPRAVGEEIITRRLNQAMVFLEKLGVICNVEGRCS